jgi:hypothetical protein
MRLPCHASIQLLILPHLEDDPTFQVQPANLATQRVSVFSTGPVWIGESKVTPAVAAFGATHLAFLFVSQFGGQISVTHVRVLLGSGVALGLGIQAHMSATVVVTFGVAALRR